MRTQGLPYPEVLVRQECQVGLFCSLVGLFCQGLPYPEVLVRQEKLTYYAQLAAVSKVTALFRSVKERHVQAQARVARESAHHDQQGGGAGGGATEQGDECDHGNESSSSELKDNDRLHMETVVDMVKQYTARISGAGHGVRDNAEDREDAEHGM
jgi:hypothetical protein